MSLPSQEENTIMDILRSNKVTSHVVKCFVSPLRLRFFQLFLGQVENRCDEEKGKGSCGGLKKRAEEE